MKRRTITDAALEALKIKGIPLPVKEIYNIIIEQDLYKFNAENPQNILQVEIRRHCEGVEFTTARPNKYFQILKDGKYWINNVPIPGISNSELKTEIQLRKDSDNIKSILSELKAIHSKHNTALRKQILNQLKEIDPKAFEAFSKRLLEIYGFTEVTVTSYFKDGGIDGYGKLNVGISNIEVGFQSKRWKNNPVSQKEIQSFRGTCQGKFEQGIYFTTSTYTKGAIDVSIQKGAVPVILIDGELIVDIMIDKEFGVDIENIPVYINALDKALTEEL